MSLLRYRGGAHARAWLAHQRDPGALAREIGTYVCPATGPKWLVAYGIDRALVEAEILRPGPAAPLLAGASAGAWRALALSSPDPLAALDELAHRYVEVVFSARDRAPDVSRRYRTMLEELFSHRIAPTIDGSGPYPIAIETARLRAPRRLFAAGLAAGALLNTLSPRAQRAAMERTTFASPGAAPLLAGPGRTIPLSRENWLDAALASGAVPFYMEPVRAIAGAGAGPFIDGGMTDYHLGRPYAHDGLTLLVSHQERVIERWLDQYVPWRRERPRLLERVLHVFPSDAFVASLPGGRVPTRDDFRSYATRPRERIAAWEQVLGASLALGAELRRDLEAGRIAERIEPIGAAPRAAG